MKSTVLKEEFKFFSRFHRRSKVKEKVLTNFFCIFASRCSATYLSFSFLGSRAVKNFPPRHVSSILFCVNAEKNLPEAKEGTSLVKTTHSFY